MSLVILAIVYRGIPAAIPVIEGYEVIARHDDWLKATRESDGAQFFLGIDDPDAWLLTPCAKTPEGHDGADTENTIRVPK